jgi:Zn-dependent peptidase ImmA (M78 family)
MTNSNRDNRQKAPEAHDDVIGRLRHMMPLRPLAFWEHRTIAEHQAAKLLDLLDQHGPAADLTWLTELSKVQVVLVQQWRMDGLSGMTSWRDGRWIIGINKGNPPARRRFTLVHEFKHALDANRDTVTYKGLNDNQRELIADYFAACYLMPKTWLRRVWTHGLQDPEALAGLFKVSRQAMDKRLHDLGFTDTEPDRTLASYFRTPTLPRDLAA